MPPRNRGAESLALGHRTSLAGRSLGLSLRRSAAALATLGLGRVTLFLGFFIGETLGLHGLGLSAVREPTLVSSSALAMLKVVARKAPIGVLQRGFGQLLSEH